MHQRPQQRGERERKRPSVSQPLDPAIPIPILPQEELEALKPVLAQSQKDTELLMEEIKEKLPGVELKRTEVQADAAVAEAEAAECLAGKKSVEEDLSVAMPALNAAIKVICCLRELCGEGFGRRAGGSGGGVFCPPPLPPKREGGEQCKAVVVSIMLSVLRPRAVYSASSGGTGRERDTHFAFFLISQHRRWPFAAAVDQ